MRKLSVRVSALAVFFIFICSLVYCSADDFDCQDDKTGSPASIAACIPVALAEYLLEMDIDITVFQLVSLQNPSGKLSLLEAEYQGKNICLLKTPAGKGIFLLDQKSPLPGRRGVLVAFDVQQDTFHTYALSTQCIIQMSSTLQSVFYTIYDCAVAGSVRSCVVDVMSIFTNLYLLSIACQEDYTLTIVAINGTVTKEPDKATYTYGEEVIITAVPNAGYSFVYWGADAFGSDNPTVITMDSDKNIMPNFATK